MKIIANTLATQLERKLKKLVKLEDAPLSYSEKAIIIVYETISELKKHVSTHNFPTEKEEIEFFKIIKPHFLSKLIYFNAIYNIELTKPVAGAKAVAKHYQHCENKLKKFYLENIEFYRYYRSANEKLDKNYFLRGNHDLKLIVNCHFFQSDFNFSTSHDFIVAEIMANDDLLKFLQKKLTKEAQITLPENALTQPKLQWTGTKVALVELIYAVHSSGVINNGNVSLNTLAQTAEAVFSINLKQFNRIFIEIKGRKSIEQTSFLNSLKNNLEKKLEEGGR